LNYAEGPFTALKIESPNTNNLLNADLHRQFSAIIEHSDDAILSKNLEGIILTWNRGAEKIFGYTAAEVIGQPVSILMPEEYKNEAPDILARIRRGETVDHYETVRRRKDGSRVNISLTVSPIKDSLGNIVGASKIARDITRHKSAEELQLHFSAIVESSDDAILSKDLQGTVRSWNRAAEKIFGYTAPEIIGRSVTTLIPAGQLNEETEILSRIRRGEKVEHYETVRQRKDGSLVNISLTVSPIKNSQGRVIGASKIARDITPQKKAEQAVQKTREELARLNEELERRVQQRTESLNLALAQMEEFSYSVSHDLRSPARAMQAYATALFDDYGDRLDDVGRDYLQRIIRSSTRMDRLILDVLVYSRIAQSEMPMNTVCLDALLPDIIQEYQELQPSKARIILHSPLHTVMAHESSLSQALSNVLINAVKFVAPGVFPEVNLRSECKGNRVRLRIMDNGIGIKPEFQSRLFGMFERANQDLPYEGTGIGLAIVRKAVEKMGGSVGVESDGKNGTSVWIDLAAATSAKQVCPYDFVGGR
jgi:PAS domain S-box-containing protein